MCKYCDRTNNDFVSLNTKTIQYSGVDIAMNRQGMLRVSYYDEASYVLMKDIVNMSFCPFCGKEFTED